MTGFGPTAYVYDRLMSHVDYAGIAAFYMNCAQRFSWKGTNILDLACGTGNMSLYLLQLGFQVEGIDSSEEMLAIADEKIFSAGFTPRLTCQDMRSFCTCKEFDMVVCAFDSLNFLLQEEDVRKTCRQVFKALSQEGLFIFDLHSDYKFKELLGEQCYTMSEDDICYLWQNNYREEDNICEMKLDIFVRQKKDLYQRIEESFYERYYTPAAIRAILKEEGFEVLGEYGDLKFELPNPKNERIFYVARKTCQQIPLTR